MSQHAAIDIGYRVHHISNGHQCSNQGFNSNIGRRRAELLLPLARSAPRAGVIDQLVSRLTLVT
jgi:hypothetical protein